MARKNLSRFAVALLTVVLAASLCSRFPLSMPRGSATPPADFIALADTLSQPNYPDTVKEVFELPSFDGKNIYLEVTRPDPAKYGSGPWPVVFEASPYHGTIADREGTRIFPDPMKDGQMVGLTGFFAPRGYAVAMMDLRGTGRSEGCLDHLGPNDAKDLKLVIEWLADQNWSTGKIGMSGHSYVGSTPIVAAAQRPRGLATIAPSVGLASMYDHQFQKGVPYNLQWIGPMVAYEGLAFSRDLPPGTPAIPVVGGPTGDNWGNGPNPEFGCGWANSAAVAGPGQITGQYELWHGKRDWRAEAANVDIPVFMVHGVNDNAARIPAAEWFFGGRFDRDGDKLWLGQWDHGSTNGRCGQKGAFNKTDANARVLHPNCRFDQWKYALLAWFDKHLKGADVDTGPAVEVFLNGRDPVDLTRIYDPEMITDRKVYTADAWTRNETLTLYPDAATNSLSTTPPATNSSKVIQATANAGLANVNDSAPVVAFRSGYFDQDALLLGLSHLTLNASVTTGEVIHLVATLYRENEIGQRERIDTCAIQPQLRYGVTTIAPVIPGEEMSLPFQCFTTAHWVPAGHRLVLEVGTRSPHHASFGSDRQITIFTGPGKGSYRLQQVPDFTLFNDVALRES